jgi:hypothetical protein
MLLFGVALLSCVALMGLPRFFFQRPAKTGNPKSVLHHLLVSVRKFPDSSFLCRVSFPPPFPDFREILSGEVPHVHVTAEFQVPIRNDLVFGQVMPQRPNCSAEFLCANIE